MTRREVLEHLFHVWGVRDTGKLKKLAREYLAYQERRGYSRAAISSVAPRKG